MPYTQSTHHAQTADYRSVVSEERVRGGVLNGASERGSERGSTALTYYLLI